jgi:hypothetical protein
MANVVPSRYLSYAGWKVRGRAIIGGIDVPISQFTVESAINTIPRASMVLSLGQDSFQRKSAAAQVLAKSSEKLKVEIKLTVTPESKLTTPGMKPPRPDELPEGEFTIFEGTTSGHGYESMPDRRGYVIQAEHWLADLNYSSSLSAGLHPNNPLDLSFPAFIRSVDPNTKSGTVSGLTAPGASISLLGPDVTQDLWAKGILVWFKTLAQTDNLADVLVTGNSQLARLLGNNPTQPNAIAANALNRMSPSDAVPLNLNNATNDIAALNIANNIKMKIASLKFEDIWSRTLWDLLVGFSADFMFAVVPTVDAAYVVPWMPMQKNPWKTIESSAADRQALSGDTPRSLRTVCLRTMASDFSASLPDQNNATQTMKELGLGVYTNPKLSDGQLLVRDAPDWLATVNHELALETAANPDNLIRSAPGAPNNAPQNNGYSGTAVMQGMSPVLNNFAKSIYLSEVLKLRQGSVYGRLRTDIAPGSALKCGLADAGDGISRYVHGNAVGVTISVDCDSLQAYTSFTLAHIRTEEQNDDLGLAAHPLYKDPWIGTRLV